MKSILVMMSTYNGELYLNQLLDSVFLQKDVEINMLVRDDGSTDRTMAILDDYSKRYNLKYYTGKNLKPAKSFMDLINKADEYDYYAFCDQDDFWIDDKMITCLNAIDDSNTPMLCYCKMDVVNENLEHQDTYFRNGNYSSSLKYSTFFGSEIPGCTMVFNHALMNYLKMYNPSYISMHDAWAHKVCLVVGGKVLGVMEPLIKYRIHSHNVVGMKKRNFIDRIKKFFNKEHNYSSLTKELLSGYSNFMSDDSKIFLNKFSHYSRNFFTLSFTRFEFKIGIKERMKMIIKMLLRVY